MQHSQCKLCKLIDIDTVKGLWFEVIYSNIVTRPKVKRALLVINKTKKSVTLQVSDKIRRQVQQLFVNLL